MGSLAVRRKRGKETFYHMAFRIQFVDKAESLEDKISLRRRIQFVQSSDSEGLGGRLSSDGNATF